MPCFVSWRRSLSATLATIWMCTQEWSLICMRTTAFTFDACHQPLSCVSSLTRSSSRLNLRLPRTGTLIFICATASLGLSRVSRSASSETGCSIRSLVSLSRAMTGSYDLGGQRLISKKSGRRVAVLLVLVPDGLPVGLWLGQKRPIRIREAVVDDAQGVSGVRRGDRARDAEACPEPEARVRRSEDLRKQ